MIKEFKGKGRPVFFPVRWANAVARWILGLYSPKGTMVIHNTPNPGAETSVGIDVNIGAVAEAVRRRGLSKEQRRDAREVVRDAIDGTSIVWRDNAASVSPEWAESHMGGGGGSSPELSSTTPVAPNQSGAAAGSATTAARGDHKHPLSSNTLTASKWVRMDSNGNLETPTVQPVAVDQTTYPPQTTTVTVVTGVEWTGSVLRYKKLTLTFTSGLLTGKGSESNTTIDTPVTYNQ